MEHLLCARHCCKYFTDINRKASRRQNTSKPQKQKHILTLSLDFRELMLRKSLNKQRWKHEGVTRWHSLQGRGPRNSKQGLATHTAMPPRSRILFHYQSAAVDVDISTGRCLQPCSAWKKKKTSSQSHLQLTKVCGHEMGSCSQGAWVQALAPQLKSLCDLG